MEWLILFLVGTFFMLLGMDLLSRVHPTLHRSWRWLIRNMLYRPLRWGLRQIRRGAGWSIRWITRQIRRLIVYLGRQVGRGIHWVWARLAWRGRALAGAGVIIVLFVVLWFLSNQAADWMIGQLSSIPLRYVWWGLGVSAAVALLMWLVRAGGTGYVGRTATSGWFWRTILIVLLVAASIYGVRKFYSVVPASSGFTVVAGQEWSDPVIVPLGGQVEWASERNLVRYEAISQEEVIYAYPAPGDAHVAIPGRLSSVRFRTAETEPVVIQVRITR